MAAATRRRGNLPADTTSFVGRKHDVAEVKRLLGKARLVTLTGVGGVGKTRLAVVTAAGLQRAFDANVRGAVELNDDGLLVQRRGPVSLLPASP